MSEAITPHGGRVRVFLMDEARLGQQGTLTGVWAPTGSRPTAVKQTRYEWVYLYAAVEPATGESVALLAPNVNTGTFNVFLKMLVAEVKPDEHVVLLMDQAGWLAQEQGGGAARVHYGAAPATILAGTESGREPLAPPA